MQALLSNHLARVTMARFLSLARSKQVRNMLGLLLYQGIGAATPLIIFPLLFRGLGSEQFGLFAFTYSAAVLASVLTEYGFNFTSVREVARAQGDSLVRNQVFWKTLLGKGMVCLVVLPGLLGILILGPSDVALYLPAASLVLANVFNPLWYALGTEQVLGVALVFSFARMVSFAAVFALGAESMAVAFWLLSLGVLLPNIALVVWFAVRDVGWARGPLAGRALAALRDGAHLFVSTAIGNLTVQAPVLLLGFFAPLHFVGIYSAIDKLCFMLRFSYQPVTKALFPMFARLVNQDLRIFSRRIALLAVGGALVFVGAALLVAFSSSKIVEIYLGTRDELAAHILSILVFASAMTFLRSVFVTLGLIPLSLDRAALLVQLVLVGVFLALFYIFLGDFERFPLVVLGAEFVATLFAVFFLVAAIWMRRDGQKESI